MDIRFADNLSAQRDNKKRLSDILRYIEDFIFAKEYTNFSHITVFYIVKIFTDRINTFLNEDTINGKRNNNKYDPLGDFYNYNLRYVEPEKDFDISLARDPVITNIWNTDSLTKAFCTISEDNNSFVHQGLNHEFRIFLPMGVTEVYNGNHSVNSASLKGDGILHVYKKPRKGFIQAEICDMSHLYDEYYYDGTYFRSKYDKHFKMKGTFESGCIFEIGRCIHEKGISFI